MTFGEKLYELRKKSAMSQDTLAERLEVTRQSVSKWERDEAFPETDKVIRIAQIFNVTTDYLLMAEEPSRCQTPSQVPYFSTFWDRAEKTIRRHGYKYGYLLIAIGAAICLFSIVLRLLWPAIAGSFLGSFQGAGDSLADSIGQIQPTVSFGNGFGNFTGSIPSMEGMLQNPSDLYDSFQQSAQQGIQQAVQAQANLFLIGLVPGSLLIAAGLFVVIKGKQIADSTPK